MVTHRESAGKDRLQLSGQQSHASSPPPQQQSLYQNAAEDLQQPERVAGMPNREVKNAVVGGGGGGKEDPMSHRIIEKRRRDRMNNCLADLSRLIPAEYMKKGRGRVEKTEIIEMAIKHMKYLQSNVSPSAGCQSRGTKQPEPAAETEKAPEPTEKSTLVAEQYKMGFFECLTETMQYLVEGHGYPPGHGLCLSLINHLQNHCSQVIKGKQVVRDDMKDEIVFKVNRFNANMLMNLEVDGDANYEETDQQKKSSSKNSQSHSSISTSNEQTLADRCSMSFTTDSYSSNGSMYKFKTEIKQRFSAENNSGVVSAEYYTTPDKKRRRIESSDGTEDRQDVPIFALHANGSYYIPLTVNRDVISPVLDNVLLTENRSPSTVIVHPISIAVNFQANAGQL